MSWINWDLWSPYSYCSLPTYIQAASQQLLKEFFQGRYQLLLSSQFPALSLIPRVSNLCPRVRLCAQLLFWHSHCDSLSLIYQLPAARPAPPSPASSPKPGEHCHLHTIIALHVSPCLRHLSNCYPFFLAQIPPSFPQPLGCPSYLTFCSLHYLYHLLCTQHSPTEQQMTF